MEPKGLPRLLMHLANVLVILFIMLPIIAVVLGSVQSEKTLQGESRRVIPSEWTLDNFTVILTQGQQKGRIFEQATYLPDNIKSFYRAFANSLIVALGVTWLTVGLGALSASERRALSDLLRKLLVSEPFRALDPAARP